METAADLRITDTAFGGYGVGRDNQGRVIFVYGAVEGDVCSAEITERKKNFAFAVITALKKPSPLRIKPVCPKAGKCGGCSFAHINYDAQINIKLKILKNAFRKFPSLPEINVHKSPDENYRIRASVKAKNGQIGFIGFKSDNFIPVKSCPVINKSLFGKIKEFAEVNNITGEIKAIETPSGAALAWLKADSGIKDRCSFDGVSFNGNISGLAHTAYDTPFGPVGAGCGTFFQGNGFLIDEFQNRAVSLVPDMLSVTELYAGSGFFTCGLVSDRREVKAVEFDKISSSIGKQYGYPIVQGDSGEFLRKIKSTDCIFLDPPREGADKIVINEILRLKPLYIVYVSCDPQTLARDVAKLSDIYKICSIDFFDMFPNTYHVETVVLLKRG